MGEQPGGDGRSAACPTGLPGQRPAPPADGDRCPHGEEAARGRHQRPVRGFRLTKLPAWKLELESPYRRRFPRVATAMGGQAFHARWLCIEADGTVRIPARYAWDGCSPKWNVLGLFLLGTPDGAIVRNLPMTWEGSLVHDAFYQYFAELEGRGLTKQIMDEVFRDLLAEARFPLAGLYHWAVATFGRAFVGELAEGPPDPAT